MKQPIIIMAGIGIIGACEIVALIKGIDGTALAASIGIIAGLLGYTGGKKFK